MAYVQKVTPPPNQILDFSLRDYSGGLNNNSTLLEENEAHLSLNMMFTDQHVMEKRKGTEYYDELDLEGEVVFIDEFEPYVGESKMIRATRSRLYVGDTLVKTISGVVSGTNFNGQYVFADGSGIYVYGKFPQQGGTYQRVLGTPTENYIVAQVVSPPENFTPLDKEHTSGRYAINYDSRKVWYEPCEFELEDTNKGFNVPPENIRFLVSHNGRLYASGDRNDDDNVFITDLRNPFYYPVSLPIQLPPNSDSIRGLFVYDNSVLIGREKDLHIIQGDTNRLDTGHSPFRLRKLNSHTGFANNRAINVAHNFLFFLGGDGNAYALQSVNYDQRVLSTLVISKQINILKAPINLEFDDIEEATSYFHADMWYVSMRDKVLVYSYRHRSWTMFTGLNARSFYHKRNILIWGNDSGRLCKFSENYYDLGKPFLARWASKNFDMGSNTRYKQFREFFIVAHTFEDWHSDIRVKFEVDHIDVRGETIISNQISRWGISKFGDRFITRNINASFPFVIGRRGRYLRFILTNGYDVHDEVYSVADLAFVTEKKDGETLVYVRMEDKYYLFKNSEWVVMERVDLDQTMRVYEINGDYEFRGKR